MKVLVTGLAGKLGRLVGARLLSRGHEVIGIDRRDWPGRPEAIQLYQCDLRKRDAEEVFRTERPDACVHMATVTHIKEQSNDRFKINLLGTRAVFDHCHAYGVGKALFIGRHTYYGAAADAPLYHQEADPPMAASSFPELADLVAADLYAGSALWRYPEIETAVLRVCYTLGPARHGTLASFLRGPRVPTVMGFDPLFQIIHEEDVGSAICAALGTPLRGVFNVAGPPPLPLSVLIRETGRHPIPVPELFFRLAIGRFGLPRLPRGALDHVKFPVIIDDGAFRKATGFAHSFDDAATMKAFRNAGG